jgi:hypothetical protein
MTTVHEAKVIQARVRAAKTALKKAKRRLTAAQSEMSKAIKIYNREEKRLATATEELEALGISVNTNGFHTNEYGHIVAKPKAGKADRPKVPQLSTKR